MLTCPLAIHSKYAALPEPGGVNAQDPLWIEDLLTFIRQAKRKDEYWSDEDIAELPELTTYAR